MDYPHHMAAIRELDLSACHPGSVVDRVTSVPALKTSAAFFTFLRANLALHSAMSSATSTPQFGPSTPFGSVVAPSPSPLSSSLSRCSSASDLAGRALAFDDDDVPPLSLEVLDTKQDKADGLRLVADSVAQMRQRAASALVFHPLCIAGLAAALATVYRVTGLSRLDLGLTVTISCGVVMSYLMAIRYATSGYIALAERMGWGWLRADDGGEQDMVLAARFNGEIIAALVLRLAPNPSFVGKKKPRSLALRGGKGVIRAWTTALKYRGKGIGQDLLYEAVRITKERCGRDAEVGFAQEHANSAKVLPAIFNSTFRQNEVLATKALTEVLSEWEMVKKRR